MRDRIRGFVWLIAGGMVVAFIGAALAANGTQAGYGGDTIHHAGWYIGLLVASGGALASQVGVVALGVLLGTTYALRAERV